MNSIPTELAGRLREVMIVEKMISEERAGAYMKTFLSSHVESSGERMNWLLKEATKWIIITDLDGTIIDSEAANSNALQQVLEEFGYVNHRTTILRVVAEGQEFREVMKMLNITPEIKGKMKERMKSILVQTRVTLLPGVIENLIILRDMGFLLCISTDNYGSIVDHIICEHSMSDLFESKFILASDTFPVRKPSPDIVKELMNRTGRKKAIILGNTPKEIAMAQSSGCPAVIIMEGNETESEIAKKKGTFEYELKAFGGISGNEIYRVKDWKETRNMIIKIIQKKNGGDENDRRISTT